MGEASVKNGAESRPRSKWTEEISRAYPEGVFEFPWRDEGVVVEPPVGWDLKDVFFSSLVGGRSTTIAAAPATVLVGEDSSAQPGGDADGGDCIWSCALRQPLY